jgi:hypothetical protein
MNIIEQEGYVRSYGINIQLFAFGHVEKSDKNLYYKYYSLTHGIVFEVFACLEKNSDETIFNGN